MANLSHRIGNTTIGKNPAMSNQTTYDNKAFSAMYVGYYATDFADYHLDDYCPTSANHTFYVGMSRNKQRKEDSPETVTRLLCEPFYYMQNVTAKIDAQTKRPLSVTPTSEKQPLPSDVWDSAFFEYSMNQGSQKQQPRGSLPLGYFPDQLERLSTTQLSLGVGGAIVPNMVGLAVGASNRSLIDLLAPEVLKASYESVYRLILARSMTEILDQDFHGTQDMGGEVDYETSVITLVPAFVYVVEGLLGVVSLCSIALLVISLKRKWSLHSDPATICTVMSLVAGNPSLLEEFGRLDCATMEDFEAHLKEKRFKIHLEEQRSV